LYPSACELGPEAVVSAPSACELGPEATLILPVFSSTRPSIIPPLSEESSLTYFNLFPPPEGKV